MTAQLRYFIAYLGLAIAVVALVAVFVGYARGNKRRKRGRHYRIDITGPVTPND